MRKSRNAVSGSAEGVVATWEMPLLSEAMRPGFVSCNSCGAMCKRVLLHLQAWNAGLCLSWYGRDEIVGAKIEPGESLQS